MKRLTAAIPQTTTPLTKFIRTTEGWLVVIFNAGMIVLPILTNYPIGNAVKWAAILNTGTVIARSGLKAIAAISKNTGITPTEPTGVPTELGGLPTDDMTDTNTLSDKPQSGVVPDPGANVTPDATPSAMPPAPAAPSGGTGTGPAPGARIPGARRKG